MIECRLKASSEFSRNSPLRKIVSIYCEVIGLFIELKPEELTFDRRILVFDSRPGRGMVGRDNEATISGKHPLSIS